MFSFLIINISQQIKTLFLKNVDMSINSRELFTLLTKVVSRTDIQKVTRTRELAFIDFCTRQSAEMVYERLNGFWHYIIVFVLFFVCSFYCRLSSKGKNTNSSVGHTTRRVRFETSFFF